MLNSILEKSKQFSLYLWKAAHWIAFTFAFDTCTNDQNRY